MEQEGGPKFSFPLDQSAPYKSSDSPNTAKKFISALYRRLKNRRLAQLVLSKGRGPQDCANEAILCVFLCHNDKRFLRSFLEHYRSLGVTRFICVDDQSSDGSRQFLQEQDDVDLWVSAKRYKEARRGKAWREWLMSRYGFGRWYLNVDSDEYFVAPWQGRMPLAHYIEALDRQNIRRVAAPMIDLYPAGPLAEAKFSGIDGTMPWQIAPLFDVSGYEGSVVDAGPILRGGVRSRIFGSDNHLMKYPLLYWDRFCTLGASIHWPKPAAYNFTSEWGVLLHFKIFSDLAKQTQAVIDEGQHMSGAASYVTIRDAMARGDIEDLSYEGSVEYEGPESLRAHGFLQSAVDPEGNRD